MSNWYIKKPIRVQAFRYGFDVKPEWMYGETGKTWDEQVDKDYEYLMIYTLEGDMRADWGDYIIKGIESEIYPCKSHIFEKTYSLAPELIEEELI